MLKTGKSTKTQHRLSVSRSLSRSRPVKSPDRSRLPTINDLETSLAEGLIDLKASELNKLAKNLIRTAYQSCGLKVTDPPYNAHKDLMFRYIREVFNLNSERWTQLEQAALLERSTHWKPAVRLWVKHATDLPGKDADGSVDPYFRAYLAGECGKKSYKSPYIPKCHNPVWNQLVVVPIKVQTALISRPIIIEFWDWDSDSVLKTLAEFRSIRSLYSAYNGIRDLTEVLLSKTFSVNVDDRIGRALIPTNTIPAMEMSFWTMITDHSGFPVGTVHCSAVWGSRTTTDLKRICSQLTCHVRILRHFLLWHCRQVITKVKSHRDIGYNTLDYSALFYIPAMTLINQHRIQINIGYWDNVMLTRCTTVSLVIEQLTSHNNSSTLSMNPSCLRALLISLLATSDLNDPRRSYENYYIKFLERIHVNLIEKLFTTYLPFIPTLAKSSLSSLERTPEHYEFLQFFRLFSRVNRLYAYGNFRRRLNSVLSKIITDHFESGVRDYATWSDLITGFEDFHENISRYWSQSFCSILGAPGSSKIQQSFENHAKERINQIIADWSEDPETNHQRLLNVYFFTKRLDLLFGGSLIEECDPVLQNYYVRRIDTIRGLTTRLDTRLTSSPPKVQSGLFSNLINMLGTRKNYTNGSVAFDGQLMTSLLPTSIVGMTAGAVQSIQIKSSQRILNPNELTFGQDFRLRDKFLGLGFRKIFPPNLQEKLIEMMKRRAEESIAKAIERESGLRGSTEYQGLSERLDVLFYELLACTMYFFVTLEEWGEDLFDSSVYLFLNAIRSFCIELKTLTLNWFQEANLQSVSSSSRLIMSINCLSIVRGRYLRKIFIEILTDKPSREIWNCFWTYFDLKLAVTDDEHVNEMELGEKLLASELEATVVKRLMATFLLIETLCFEINKMEDELIVKLGEDFLGHQLSSIKAAIESIEKNKSAIRLGKDEYDQLIASFSFPITNLINQLASTDVKVNWLLSIRHNLVVSVSEMARYLQDAYHVEVKTGQDVQSRVTRIQLIKLSVIAKGCSELINDQIHKIKSPLGSDLTTLLENSKLDFGFDSRLINRASYETEITSSKSQ